MLQTDYSGNLCYHSVPNFLLHFPNDRGQKVTDSLINFSTWIRFSEIAKMRGFWMLGLLIISTVYAAPGNLQEERRTFNYRNVDRDAYG